MVCVEAGKVNSVVLISMDVRQFHVYLGVIVLTIVHLRWDFTAIHVQKEQ